jgi:RecG-like helicase
VLRVAYSVKQQGECPPSLDATRNTQHASLTIGTHALLTAGFELPNLGLVIIDEQHKFGVAQREQFVRKGRYPHLLVMTATPIPRTLGLTLYGDLDVSVIDLTAARPRATENVCPPDRRCRRCGASPGLSAGRQAMWKPRARITWTDSKR